MPAVVRAHRAGKDVGIPTINPYLYNYKTNISTKCRQKDLFLLFLVKSAVSHFDRRSSIRSTWGNEDSLLTNFTFKTIFLVGEQKNANPGLQKILEHEIDYYKDILQMSFTDSYYNNTQKTVGGIHWAVHNCNHARFVMFVDDDFFVATHFLVRYLSTLSLAQQKTLFEGFLQNDRPFRFPLCSWYVKYEYYPYDKYPPFLSAGAMITSMHLLKDIQIAMQYTKNFIFDDIFLAIVVFKLGITPQNNVNIFIWTRVGTDSKEFHSMIASHHYNNDYIMQLAWQAHVNFSRKVIQLPNL
ncbi:beta-1,3-galactosyltransferase brn-like [Mizuhopecten yessoensis]|uniref:beta-1,3-galactosyltransferase brn-like n=1 Tax=Mizuhopecten yessoensis TaxID=6573 RepID=UPI000B45EEAC|nr:beta-1,3-galactosyltransferase brn-like [Mizuhopecten yessoensis]